MCCKNMDLTKVSRNGLPPCIQKLKAVSQTMVFFKLSKGVRQGCPISALLFLLVVDVIAVILLHSMSKYV